MILIEGMSGREGTVSKAGTVAGDVAATVYRLRVVLSGISPMIWRQLEVPAAFSLAQLHEVLQASFAWSGEHLYRFTVHGREFGSGQLWLRDPSTVRLADLGLRHRGHVNLLGLSGVMGMVGVGRAGSRDPFQATVAVAVPVIWFQMVNRSVIVRRYSAAESR
jgi:hypothetical protein